MAELPFVLLASTALSAGSSLVGGVQTAQAASFNRRQALMEADARRAEAAREAGLATEQAARVFGQAEVAGASSGFTLQGSAADVLGDIAGQRSYNTRAILQQGAIERAALLDEAAAQKRAGQAGILRGVLGAGASVLGATRARAPAAGVMLGARAPMTLARGPTLKAVTI